MDVKVGKVEYLGGEKEVEIFPGIVEVMQRAYQVYRDQSLSMMRHKPEDARVFNIAFVSANRQNCVDEVGRITDQFGDGFEINQRDFCQNRQLPRGVKVYCWNINYSFDRNDNPFRKTFVVAYVEIK